MGPRKKIAFQAESSEEELVTRVENLDSVIEESRSGIQKKFRDDTVHDDTQEMLQAAEDRKAMAPKLVDMECYIGYADDQVISLVRSGMMVCVDEILDQVILMNGNCKAPKMEMDLRYQSIEERFGIDLPSETLFDPVSLQSYDEQHVKMMGHIKYQHDRTWLELLLMHALLELKSKSTFDSIGILINFYERTRDDEINLLKGAAANRQKCIDLQSTIAREKTDTLREIQRCNELIGDLKDLLEDNNGVSAVKIRYVKDWENCRQEKKAMILNKEKTALYDTIDQYSSEIRKEEIVHNELSEYVRYSTEEFNEQIEYWLHKYEKDIDEMTNNIEKLRTEREEQLIELGKLRDQCKKQKIEMEEWKAYKEERRKEAEEHQRKVRAATKIQAWWRGTMFRKGLGPYRPRKKKKTGKSGKEKKGKGDKKK